MDKESIFFSCLIIFIVFEVGYYLINPSSTWMLGVGAITGIVVIGIATGLLAGINIASSGEIGFGARLAFISATLFTLLFRFDIPTSTISGTSTIFFGSLIPSYPGSNSIIASTVNIPVGIGLLYPNMYNIFVIPNDTNPAGMFGMIIMSVIILLMVVSGLLIAAGDGS